MKTKLLKKVRNNNQLVKVTEGRKTYYYWRIKGKQWVDSDYVFDHKFTLWWEKPLVFRVDGEYLGWNHFETKEEAMNVFMMALKIYYSDKLSSKVYKEEIVWFNKK